MEPRLWGEGQLRVDRLTDLEHVIERGMGTFVEVGQALYEIREQRFYREAGFPNFEDYCRERWGWRRAHAHRMITAAEAVSIIAAEEASGVEVEVSPMGDTSPDRTTHTGGVPANERQARELARLKDPDLIRDVWRSVLRRHPEGVTAADIRELVDDRLGKQAAEKRQEKGQETVERILDLVADPGEREARALARECADALAQFYRLLQKIEPDRHIPVLDVEERELAGQLVRDVRIWAGRIEAALTTPLRLLGDGDDE